MSIHHIPNFGTELTARAENLEADYIPDSSGRYVIYFLPAENGGYLVTTINGDEAFAERLERRPALDDAADRAEFQLTDRFAVSSEHLTDEDEDAGAASVVWIGGTAYAAFWADEVVAITFDRAAASDADTARAVELAKVVLRVGEFGRNVPADAVTLADHMFEELERVVGMDAPNFHAEFGPEARAKFRAAIDEWLQSGRPRG